jgi:signal transduction histidine kinase
MSELDFSETLAIKGNDEISQLSLSINDLSHKLDITIGQLNDKNRQLEEDIDRERRLDKMRQEFISSVSHELKTPIFLIQGYADGLKANISTDEDRKNFYCDVIMDEAEKLNILVKDLLDLSQIQSGVFNISRCNFSLTDLVKEIGAKFGPDLLKKEINLNMQTEENLLVNADPVRIEQVLVNYLNNAVNHVDEKKEINITAVRQGRKARIAVYNSGRHIPEKEMEKIWTSFYKVDKARTREYGGTGLGLSIVRAIMEAHQNPFGVRNVADGVEFHAFIDLALRQ